MPLRRGNPSIIPQGMLAPSGFVDTPVNEGVQSTTRPAGTLLPPSPGYDSVRVGKNRFQGKGPTGGFRPLEFAEDVGGTGAALAVVPGETSQIAASEWLPDESGLAPEGSMIISDRKLKPGLAGFLHSGMFTMPDMGDRTQGRPLSKAWWQRLSPATYLSEDYKESPVAAVLMGMGLVYVVYLISGEAERQIRGTHRVEDIPSSTVEGGGDVATESVRSIEKATDRAVGAIEAATDKAVGTIEKATDKAT